MTQSVSNGRTGTDDLPEPKRIRRAIRIHPDTDTQAEYWAKRAGLSVNAYMAEAVEEKIARENGDYDLPTLEIQRLNQIIDEMRSNSENMANLEQVVLHMARTITDLARGDNYLSDAVADETGELDE